MSDEIFINDSGYIVTNQEEPDPEPDANEGQDGVLIEAPMPTANEVTEYRRQQAEFTMAMQGIVVTDEDLERMEREQQINVNEGEVLIEAPMPQAKGDN